MSDGTVIECHESVAIDGAVLTATVDALHEKGIDIPVVIVRRMSHVGVVRGRERLLLLVVPVRIVYDGTVNDEAGVAVDAAQCLIVCTLRGDTSLASCEHAVHDRAATDVYQGGAIGGIDVVVA